MTDISRTHKQLITSKLERNTVEYMDTQNITLRTLEKETTDNSYVLNLNIGGF